MAEKTTDKHFSGTVRTTKDDLRYGPLKWRRLNAIPSDTYGRNGDFVIVDDSAVINTSSRSDSLRIPTEVRLCQKIPIQVTSGTFQITAPSGAYTIEVNTVDDFADAVNNAKIPELRVEYTTEFITERPQSESYENGVNFSIRAVGVTFTDGTSDLPSVLGIAGFQNGTIIVPVGTWECFTVGAGQIDVALNGVPVLGTPFSELNFLGTGIVTIDDAGSGTVNITTTGGVGSGLSYSSIVGDSGTAVASTSEETITFTGTGIRVTSTDAGPDLDSVSFDMDISDLPAGGPPSTGDEVAVNIGGNTVKTPISSLPFPVIPGLTISIINGQPTLVLEDTTRANKKLSISEQSLTFSNNTLGASQFMHIGTASDADTSYIAEFDGTIVYASAFCENTQANSKELRLFINGSDVGLLGVLSGGANASFTNTTLNVDFSQGDRIRIRAGNTDLGSIQDTVAKIVLKWRGL